MEAAREGFLCPTCMRDLGDIEQLWAHFEREHTSTEAGGDRQTGAKQNLKEFFGKAKQVLRTKRSTGVGATDSGQLDSSSTYSGGLDVDERGRQVTDFSIYWREAQPIGAKRSHLTYFKSCREALVDQSVSQTNKLLLRIDKLLSVRSHVGGAVAVQKSLTPQRSPGASRRAEQTIAPWLADSAAVACMRCGTAFTMLRVRRHHCRLCGELICSSCSHFLVEDFARHLTDPSQVWLGGDQQQQDSGGFIQRKGGSSESLSSSLSVPVAAFASSLRSGFSKLQSSTSDSGRSSPSTPSSAPALTATIRVCTRCRQLLERHHAQQRARTELPPLLELYEQLMYRMQEADRLLAEHEHVTSRSSNRGVSLEFGDVQELRSRIFALRDEIDTTSKKILQLGVTTTLQQRQGVKGGTPTGKDQMEANPPQLHVRIRHRTNLFLQDLLCRLPNPPLPRSAGGNPSAHSKQRSAGFASRNTAQPAGAGR